MESGGNLKDFLKFFSLKTKMILLVSICIIILVFNISETKQILKTATSSLHFIHKVITDQTEIPTCQQNLLNVDHYDFNKWGREFSQDRLLTSIKSPSSSCRLLHISAPLLVKCIDIAHQHKQMIGSNHTNDNKLHFAFIGDSRIRQHYYSFFMSLPHYDMITNFLTYDKHKDVKIQSEILRLKITFLWRPIIDEEILEMIKQFTISAEKPDMLLIGMEAHHMMAHNNGSIEDYKVRLGEFSAALDQLGKLTNVIWLMQHSTNDVFRDNLDHPNNLIFREKIDQFNDATLQIFQSHRHVRLWNSTIEVFEEYIRSCKLWERHGRLDFMYSWYTSTCYDYIHPSNIAVSQATQVLLNDFCNTYLDI